MAKKAVDYLKSFRDFSKPIIDHMPGIKAVEPTGYNYWTGFRVTKSATALFGGIAVAGAIASVALEGKSGGEKAKRQMAAASATSVGPIAATMYESTGARSNLGATGDLVLGLNNMRRGSR